jgi:uncharacterized MAPEG superfamily protein
MSIELKAKQALTRRLIPIGLFLAAATIGLLYLFVPPLHGVDTPVDRLIVALRCHAVAAVTLLAGIQAVASQRGQTEAIDPIAGAGRESRLMQVHARYAQNTLEQLVIFVLATAALSTFLDAGSIHLVPILTGAFILGRVLFWVGYLINPMYRTPGMAINFTVNGLALIYVLYRTVRLVLDV